MGIKKNKVRKLNAEQEWKRINIIDVVQLKNDRKIIEGALFGKV